MLLLSLKKILQKIFWFEKMLIDLSTFQQMCINAVKSDSLILSSQENFEEMKLEINTLKNGACSWKRKLPFLSKRLNVFNEQ